MASLDALTRETEALLAAYDHYQRHMASGHECKSEACAFEAWAPVLGYRSGTCSVCEAPFWAAPKGRMPSKCPEHSSGNKRCSSCGSWCRPRQGNSLCSECFKSECRHCGALLQWPLTAYCGPECKSAYKRRSAISCKGCGCVISNPDKSQYYCSVPCRRRSYRLKKPEVANGPRKPRPWDERRKASWQERRARMRTTAVETIRPVDVFTRDGWTCHVCKTGVDRLLEWPHPLSVSLDHVVPLARGGTHTMDNLACSHLRCNLQKSDKVIADE